MSKQAKRGQIRSFIFYGGRCRGRIVGETSTCYKVAVIIDALGVSRPGTIVDWHKSALLKPRP